MFSFRKEIIKIILSNETTLSLLHKLKTGKGHLCTLSFLYHIYNLYTAGNYPHSLQIEAMFVLVYVNQLQWW